MREMEAKEERMRQMFVDKVKQKEAELKKAEQDVKIFEINTNRINTVICVLFLAARQV